MSLDKLVVLVANLISSFIGSSELYCPLLILYGHATAPCVILLARHLHAFISLTAVHVVHAAVGRVGHQILAELESLCGPSKHVMKLAV